MSKERQDEKKVNVVRERILILVDDPDIRTSLLERTFEKAGYTVLRVNDLDQANEVTSRQLVDVVVINLDAITTDIRLSLRKLRASARHSVIVARTLQSSESFCLRAIRYGINDVLLNPLSAEEILFAVRKAQTRLQLARRVLPAQPKSSDKPYGLDGMIAQSPKMLDLFETVKKVAEFQTNVLISGESGTGKELIARAIHSSSERANGPFVAVNCGAIPENLLESELFGHVRGAFTDATRDKPGLLEAANNGSLLLDEVAELPLTVQVKLLRVLQERIVTPVGGTLPKAIDVRLIAASHKNLEQAIIEGSFRQDLFYRLNVVGLSIPPLRERREDIPLLLDHFIRHCNEKFSLSIRGVSSQALKTLMNYRWPGNVRELENAVERAILLSDSDILEQEYFTGVATPSTGEFSLLDVKEDELSIKVHMRRVEKILIQRALEQTGGNRSQAARLLEISHRTLLYKLKDYGG